MDILSLFDGMSCGQIALNKIGFRYGNYYSSEIDEYAIKVTQKNYPNTIQLGDINKWHEWDIKWDKIGLVLAGSPCQGFSLAGKQLAFGDERSKLFFKFVDILKYIQIKNPSVKFLLENVVMKRKYQDVISNILDVEPVLINSSLVSAQNRKRNYWCNWSFPYPQDKGIFLYDIWDGGIDITERVLKKKIGTLSYKKCFSAIRRLGEKSKCLLCGGQGISNSGATNIKIGDKFFKPTPLMSERLQNVPDNYTSILSTQRREHVLGNGWTIDIIAHILKYIKNQAIEPAFKIDILF